MWHEDIIVSLRRARKITEAVAQNRTGIVNVSSSELRAYMRRGGEPVQWTAIQ
jgi:hypothetical protein